MEFDHADIYDNLEAVKTAFRRLVNLVPRRGRVIAFDGSPNVDECVARAFCSIERYGFKPGSAWQLRDLTHDNRNSSWKIFRSGREWLEVTLPLPGEHNALNATAAAALAAGQGIDPASIVEGSIDLPQCEAQARGARRGRTGSRSSMTLPTTRPRFGRR